VKHLACCTPAARCGILQKGGMSDARRATCTVQVSKPWKHCLGLHNAYSTVAIAWLAEVNPVTCFACSTVQDGVFQVFDGRHGLPVWGIRPAAAVEIALQSPTAVCLAFMAGFGGTQLILAQWGWGAPGKPPQAKLASTQWLFQSSRSHLLLLLPSTLITSYVHSSTICGFASCKLGMLRSCL
jgi:hypothetical protein